MPTLEEMQHGVDRLDEVDRRVDYIVTHEPLLGYAQLLIIL